MNRTMRTLAEWINPAWGHHRTVPPMDAGLRPNLRLDSAQDLLPTGVYEPDDVVTTDSGAIAFSSGDAVYELRDGHIRPLAQLPGPVGALARRSGTLIAAVDEVGLVGIDPSGRTANLCEDPVVASCVTDLTVLPDGALLATVGSRRYSLSEWSSALVHGDRSGRIIRVDGPRTSIEAEDLGWPSGIEISSDSEVLVSLSLDHRIEARAVGSGGTGRTLAANLPLYPGRLSAAADGWWVAAPYIRNRVTEMLLDEPQVIEEMVASIDPADWFVPRLRGTNPYTDTMQMGQLRVLGVVKPWAPARSCGLVLRIDRSGRVAESAHARVDSARHGVTGVTVRDGQVIAAARGYRNLLRLPAEKD